MTEERKPVNRAGDGGCLMVRGIHSWNQSPTADVDFFFA